MAPFHSLMTVLCRCSVELLDFFGQTLELDAERRPLCSDLLRHVFISGEEHQGQPAPDQHRAHYTLSARREALAAAVAAAAAAKAKEIDDGSAQPKFSEG